MSPKKVKPEDKRVPVTVSLEPDLAAWLKSKGRGQPSTLVNTALRLMWLMEQSTLTALDVGGGEE